MTFILIGEEYDLLSVQIRAKQIVMENLVELAEKDGVPATLRAMYVRKASEAQIVLAGGTSYLIEGEAAERGITPVEAATKVLEAATQAGDALEVYRIRLNVSIEAAETPAEVIKILEPLGLSFTIS